MALIKKVRRGRGFAEGNISLTLFWSTLGWFNQLFLHCLCGEMALLAGFVPLSVKKVLWEVIVPFVLYFHKQLLAVHS